MKQWTHAELVKLHGRKVTCKIDGEYIDDAKISVDKDSSESVYICQNKRSAYQADDLFEYNYSYFISDSIAKFEDYEQLVTDLKLVERTLRDAVVGDVIYETDEDAIIYRKVLGIIGEVIFVSHVSDSLENVTTHEPVSYIPTFTIGYLESEGYKIYEEQVEPEVKEFSIEEVAKALGEDVKNIRIKKDQFIY